MSITASLRGWTCCWRPALPLRKIYILHTDNDAVLDLSALAAACPSLRVLVLHVLMQYTLVGSPSTPACINRKFY